MTIKTTLPIAVSKPLNWLQEQKQAAAQNWRQFPWWIAALGLIGLWVVYLISTRESFQQAFDFIIAGIGITVITTICAYLIALVLGLVAGLGRISNNVVAKNLATLYVEMIRGIPMLVLIFFIALVVVPGCVDGINALGEATGLSALHIDTKNVSMNVRAIIALSITYGAFSAEIFRAGIESIDRGQMEAARSQGMSFWQAMRYIILPQAIKNVLPAIGNDFVAMLKDSSLVSVLAVRDITQIAKLYAGASFRYPEAYTTLAIMYLTMTVILSMLIKMLERRTHKDER